MTAELVLKKLRVFLQVFSVFIFSGALVELFFLGHTREKLQFMPFFLIALGIILALVMLIKPSMRMAKVLRIGMWFVLIGGVVGMGVHVTGNLETLREPFTLWQVLKQGFAGGNPFLAPGILSMAAALSLASVFKYQV